MTLLYTSSQINPNETSIYKEYGGFNFRDVIPRGINSNQFVKDLKKLSFLLIY